MSVFDIESHKNCSTDGTEMFHKIGRYEYE